MNQPDIEGAREYALKRLETELAPYLYYHSAAHTRDDVIPATERLAKLEHVNDGNLLLLRTAAFFHDIGFVEQPLNHEKISARIAGEILPQFGYLPEQISTIQSLILATQLPHVPETLLEAILADADLDSLGREDFMARSQALRDEQQAFGITAKDKDWYQAQIKFLTEHKYFTHSAQKLRDGRKSQNIQQLRNILKEKDELSLMDLFEDSRI
jgi:uncharacterized protein